MFDVDEYLHLAIHASSVGNHHASMGYLKEVLQQQPAHALALHLLATEHAEIGLFDRAIMGMRAALAVDSRLEIARFQLGMLLLDRRRPAEAKVELAYLATSRDPALRAYSEAMIALSDNNLPLAREALTRGLSVQGANPSLQGIMRRVFERLTSTGEAPPAKPGTAESDATRQELFLGAYRQGTN
jgi:tetratricopeptide (TPR) repeat protein